MCGQIICFGPLVVDRCVDLPGLIGIAEGKTECFISDVPGGGAFTIARQVSRFGEQVRLISLIGPSTPDGAIIDAVRSVIRDSHFRTVMPRTRQSVLIGRNLCLTDRPAMERIPADTTKLVSEADYLLIAPLTPEDSQHVDELLEIHPRSILMLSKSQLQYRETAVSMLRKSWLSILNAEEARILSEQDDVNAAIARLRDLNVENVLVTSQEDIRGIIDRIPVRVKALPAAAVRQTVGAGDTVVGTMLAAFSQGRSTIESLECAMAAAVIHVEQQSQPDSLDTLLTIYQQRSTDSRHANRINITDEATDIDRFDRVARSSLLNKGADSWLNAHLMVAGCGAVGSRFVIEAVRSGVAGVTVLDPDVTLLHNLATTPGFVVGRPKVRNVADICQQFRQGIVTAVASDVRRFGPAFAAGSTIIVDATDDPDLGRYLTLVSNGVGRPLVRIAVSGNGDREIARVLGSESSYSCQMCHWGRNDRRLRRVPCRDGRSGSQATLAAVGTTMIAVGLGLTQAMRVVTSPEEALGRELYFDITGGQLLNIQNPRNQECLSGHEAWEFEWSSSGTVHQATWTDLIQEFHERMGEFPSSVEVFGESLWTEAECECGTRCRRVGVFHQPPACDCGQVMTWIPGSDRTSWLSCADIEPDFPKRSLIEFGIPDGCMVTGTTPAGRVLRLMLPPSVRIGDDHTRTTAGNTASP